MAEQDDSLFRDIDEEMRREQIAKLWKQYGTYFLAIAAAIPLSVGGYQLYASQKQAAIEASGAAYDAASQLLSGGKQDEARAAFEKIATTGPTGYATLAQLRLAAAAAKAGKTADAIAAYEALAKANSTDKLIADFARLEAASLRLDQADWTEMQNRLIELTDNSNPWRSQARELMALAALKNGEIAQARKFNELLLGERKLPQAMLERVKIMLATIIEAELAAGGGASAATKAEVPKPAEEPKKN